MVIDQNAPVVGGAAGGVTAALMELSRSTTRGTIRGAS